MRAFMWCQPKVYICLLVVCLLNWKFWQRTHQHSAVYVTPQDLESRLPLTRRQEAGEKGKERLGRLQRGEKGVRGRWQQWQFVIVMMKTRPPLSLLHIPSLPPSPFSPRVPLSFRSHSVAKNNEVTPLSRTVPYKNSALLFSQILTLLLSTSHLPRDMPVPCCSHIWACAVSWRPRAHTRRLLIDPICLIVNEQANSPAWMSLWCTLNSSVYIHLCLWKILLACLKITSLNSIFGGQKSKSACF